MADNSPIEWLHYHGKGATWNVITGCSLASPGCTNCYAMKLAGTRLRNHPSRQGLTMETAGGPVWNGQVRFNEQWLDQPLRWRAPRMIFVCAHGDLFHPDVPNEWIAAVFGVMAASPHHTFLVLTKRPERMLQWFAWREQQIRERELAWEPWRVCEDEASERVANLPAIGCISKWPLPNVWLGVSIEDRKRMLERAPMLRDTPAALRWWSAEPLLGDLGEIPDDLMPDWCVVGGESDTDGKSARPMHPNYARRVRDRFAAAGRPFFFKQWGEWHPASGGHGGPVGAFSGDVFMPNWYDTSMTGADNNMVRAGKHAFGYQLLDGVVHDAYPEISR